MTWQYLNSKTLSEKPNVLAGPILRKVTPDSVTVWFSLQKKATVTLMVLDSTGKRVFDGKRETIAVGPNLHIVAVTARRKAGESELVENAVYMYDAVFEYPTDTNTPSLIDDSIAAATTFTTATGTHKALLTYPNTPYDRPSFCLPPANIYSLRILHGSCRKPSGDGLDALAIADTLIEEKVNSPLQRPQQLLMTGDQIYADDVAASLLMMLTDAAKFLMWDELLPLVPIQTPMLASGLPPFSRRGILEMEDGKAKFSSEDLSCHLMSLGEYLCMYLFAWSDVLWPPQDVMPTKDDVVKISSAFVTLDNKNDYRGFKRGIENDIQQLIKFRATLPNVRRVLANIPSYMIFDDHEVTDDWNMTEYTAYHLCATDIGRRIVQNALVAYSLCQHWGNVPEQFLETDASLPGTRLLALLNSPTTPADYVSKEKSDAICSLVNVPTGTEVEKNHRVDHHPGSLSYNYTIEGTAHQIIVTDTRTFRTYPWGGGEAPDLLAPAQFAAQIVKTPALDGRMLIVVLTTNAPPVQPIRAATDLHEVSNNIKHFPDIHEAWDLPSVAFDRLAKALSDKVGFSQGASAKVVLLSGDVHTAFASRLHYKATKRFEDTGTQHANVVIAQLVASSFKKQTGDTIGQQRGGYQYAPYHLGPVMVPPHVTEYYIGWNVPASGQKMGEWYGRRLYLDRASSVRLIPANPAWPNPSGPPQEDWFIQSPDFSYQFDYLTMTNGGVPKTLQPLPPPPPWQKPGAPTKDELKETAHVFRLARDNYRQHNLDPAVIRHIIGVNNMGDLSFPIPPAPQTGPFIVNHRVRFRSPGGEQLFVDYAVNMETIDSAHPADPNYLQVTP